MMAVSTVGREAPNGVARVELMGVKFDSVTGPQVIERIGRGLRAGTGGWIVTVNLDILRKLSRCSETRDLVSNVDLVVADGAPVVWACQLQGTPVPERVAGSDLIWTSCAEAAEADASVFLLGGEQGCADGSAQRLQTRYPGLDVAGTACPPFGFENDPDQLRAIVDQVRASGARLVLVGLGFPKQERLISELRRVHPNAWYVGVGVSFSFVSQKMRRAPHWMQRSGLEWVHRMAQEPRRLARRYLWDGWPFGLRLLAGALFSRPTVRISRG